jgi:hypothetical protein
MPPINAYIIDGIKAKVLNFMMNVCIIFKRAIEIIQKKIEIFQSVKATSSFIFISAERLKIV